MKNATTKGLPPWTVVAIRFGIVGGVVIAVLVAGQLAVKRSPTDGKSQQTAAAVELAISNFHSDYGKVPDVGAKVQTDSEAGVHLLTILLGQEMPDGAGKVQNPRGIKYLNVREAHAKAKGLLYDPSGKSVVGLYDSWGNPFIVELDVDNQGCVRPQLGSGTVELKGKRVAVYSAGCDRKLGTADDVKTW
jgi:hypothetical protein